MTLAVGDWVDVSYDDCVFPGEITYLAGGEAGEIRVRELLEMACIA